LSNVTIANEATICRILFSDHHYQISDSVAFGTSKPELLTVIMWLVNQVLPEIEGISSTSVINQMCGV
jgi:hypothetical protein